MTYFVLQKSVRNVAMHQLHRSIDLSLLLLTGKKEKGRKSHEYVIPFSHMLFYTQKTSTIHLILVIEKQKICTPVSRAK